MRFFRATSPRYRCNRFVFHLVLPWLVGAYLVAAHAQTAEEPSLAPPTAPAEGAATDIPGSAPPALPDEFVNWVEANIEFERLLAADELPAA
jgi:hypothetical protein